MQVLGRCYAVTGLGYSPPWYVNAGFIAGEHTTLIVDTGGNAAAAATILGYAKAVRPHNRILAINTERHFDHIGGNSYLHDKGVDIFGHQSVVRTPEEFAAEISEFNGTIPSRVRRRQREAEVFFSGTRLVLPNRIVGENAPCDLGGVAALVVYTPGHTPANVSVYADQVLYSGDCLINGYLPNLESGKPADWEKWLDSLDKIQRIAPRAVVPGHGPVLIGPEVSIAIDRVRRILQEAIKTGVAPTAAQSASSAATS
jgi:glyoxylase-like metal-dependent hydrolase (beta-lactamase superfamily II)